MADRVQYGTPENVPLKYIDVSSGGVEAYAPAIAVVIDTGGGGGGSSQVEGTVADGDPAANNPILVAGEDSGTGDVHNLQLSSTGLLLVSVQQEAVSTGNVKQVQGSKPAGQAPDNPVVIAGADVGDNSVSVPFVVDGGLAVSTYNGYLSVYQIVDTNLAITQVSMSTVAAQIVATRNTRSELQLHNIGTDTVYIGKTSGVTTANGFPLAGGREVSIKTPNVLYGITASGTSVVGVIEVYS